jgi:hypothetical protein
MTTEDGHLQSRWMWAKATLAVFWSITMVVFLTKAQSAPYPVGIAHWVNLDPLLTSTVGQGIVLSLLAVLTLSYIAERVMLLTTFGMCFLSFLIITHQESQGIYARATVYTPLFAVQALAYLLHRVRPGFDLARHRLSFSVQMVAAGYTLAGIAKLWASGPLWGFRVDGMALQVLKNRYFLYADTGDTVHLEIAQSVSSLIGQYPVFAGSALTMALVLEVFCIVVVLSGRIRFVWGIGLLVMHLGIAYYMAIGISVIAFPMMAFFIEPGFRAWKALSRNQPASDSE